jgi:hypothetical protein
MLRYCTDISWRNKEKFKIAYIGSRFELDVFRSFPKQYTCGKSFSNSSYYVLLLTAGLAQLL